MSAATEVQALLRFLTKHAHIPLAEAMPRINMLRKQQLNTPEALSKAGEAELKSVFADEKVLRQVVNAAKRVSNPRKRTSTASSSPASKRLRADPAAFDDEAILSLPTTELSSDELTNITIETNRAPLFLAFTVAVLAYTHPEQPLSSRWSLAQAVVSAGAQSKAKYLGITNGPTAEEDGWAEGQPKVKIMGREVPVMRRHVVNKADDDQTVPATALWGLDLEALRRSNGPLIAGKEGSGQAGPPIHRPDAPRNYLLKSMIVINASEEAGTVQGNTSDTPKKAKSKDLGTKKEEAAAMVLKAIDIVCQSWQASLSKEDLDRRAQTWYARVRPDVAQGQAGWGQRGQVRLEDILKLQKG
ncbi:hypothetical protein A1O3_06775 [Capronia epimyces CBS 606.96]|uniref:Impact N-terminal domain-containing protein n=1 Tax=Capronia epimyces CBS 606.96 TaxID=1182542 RepID=W9XRX2_9EURO|nr:uncharacterized protein A1O3_06775 [Capronia epimyces CBS 606.96]EXJ82958.1 hypothetical protein A1O3_06775 [Capronia epimyces CBS 606.96]